MPYASYEESKCGSRRNHNCPNLNIFLTCHQVYDESSSVYYKQNLCYFDVIPEDLEVLSVSACHAFLLDRPLPSLQRLRSIELLMGNPTLNHPSAAWVDGDVLVPLINFIRDNSSLQHFSLEVHGYPPDMRSAPWDWSGTEPDCDRTVKKWVGAFSQLNNVLKSLEITLNASTDINCGRLVACAAFLRSSMLINGATLGTKNIHAYHRHCRHWHCQVRGKPCEIYCREPAHVSVVRCCDDEHGKSLLSPKAHPSPAFPGIKAIRVQQGHDPSAVEKALRDAMAEKRWQPLHTYRIFCDEDEDSDGDFADNIRDYDLSDDGDNDSLISIDLGDTDLSYVRDEEYFEHFDEHEQDFKPFTSG